MKTSTFKPFVKSFLFEPYVSKKEQIKETIIVLLVSIAVVYGLYVMAGLFLELAES
jgi:hypothetical protein